MALVLTLKRGHGVKLDGPGTIRIADNQPNGSRVVLCIEAEPSTNVVREEAKRKEAKP